ncbi:hypothetical protein ANN_11584 [Periplaneta americana]|uniref:Uncharacterized protein n=1 Tax=Periplaneta americana TaxID=6978 RepID=A0ABQ8T6J1_PERAM|nr:hypothetical protein ANN_11584 [Periplaneta americana]
MAHCTSFSVGAAVTLQYETKFEYGASAHTLMRPATPNALNVSWEEEFFLVESSGLAKCLIWHKTLQLIKKFNIQRHYSLQHATEYDKYVRNERHKLIQLKENVSQDDNNALSESAMRISYKICHEIAKELKTFNEGEFIKRCLIILADELCPQQVGEVEAIRLSRRTVVRRLQRLRWAGHVARMDESRNAYRVLVGRPEGRRPSGRPRRRWENNIKMDLREVGYDDRDWINLAQDRDQRRAYVRAAMNLRPLMAMSLAIDAQLQVLPGLPQILPVNQHPLLVPTHQAHVLRPTLAGAQHQLRPALAGAQHQLVLLPAPQAPVQAPAVASVRHPLVLQPVPQPVNQRHALLHPVAPHGQLPVLSAVKPALQTILAAPQPVLAASHIHVPVADIDHKYAATELVKWTGSIRNEAVPERVGWRKNNAETDQKEKTKSVGLLAEKKLLTEGCNAAVART